MVLKRQRGKLGSMVVFFVGLKKKLTQHLFGRGE